MKPIVENSEVGEESETKKKKKKKKVKSEASEAKEKSDLRKSHKGRESEENGLPKFSGLTAKVGISSLPSLKAKGKISRKDLKPAKLKSKRNQQERRMREPKTKPKLVKSKDDNMDKLVSRYKQKTHVEADTSSKKKRKEKWYK